MFLRLTPAIATGRAVAVLAVTAVTMSGHGIMSQGHADVVRGAIAYLLMLAVAWRTNNPLQLFAGALLGQAVVHGETAVAADNMTLMHAAGAVVAMALCWKFELVWSHVVAALQPLHSVIIRPTAAAVPALAPPVPLGFAGVLLSLLRVHSTPLRGPPVVA